MNLRSTVLIMLVALQGCTLPVKKSTPLSQFVVSASKAEHPLLQLAMHLKAEKNLPSDWNIDSLMRGPQNTVACTWKRVSCNDQKEIVELNLEDICFQTLPAKVWVNLTHLQHLSLAESWYNNPRADRTRRCTNGPKIALDLRSLNKITYLDLRGNSQIDKLIGPSNTLNVLRAESSKLNLEVDVALFPVLQELALDLSEVPQIISSNSAKHPLWRLRAVGAPLKGIIDIKNIFSLITSISLSGASVIIKGPSPALKYMEVSGDNLPDGINLSEWSGLNDIYIRKAGGLQISGRSLTVKNVILHNWLANVFDLAQTPGATFLDLSGGAVRSIKGYSAQLSRLSAGTTQIRSYNFNQTPNLITASFAGGNKIQFKGKAEKLEYLNLKYNKTRNVKMQIFPALVSLDTTLPNAKFIKGPATQLKGLTLSDVKGELVLSVQQFPQLQKVGLSGKILVPQINCGQRTIPIILDLPADSTKPKIIGDCKWAE